MPFIMFFLNNKLARIGLEILAILFIVAGLCAYIDHKGYARCEAKFKADQAAAVLIAQTRTTDALSAELMDAAARNATHQAITQKIGSSHAQDDDAPAPAIIQSTIRMLYASHGPAAHP